MSDILEKKLLKYASLSSAAILVGTHADGAIIHTTVNYTGGYETYNIDIDNDSNVDFVLNATYFTYSFSYGSQPITLKVKGANLNGYLSVNNFVGGQGNTTFGSTTYPYNYVSALNSGFNVNSTYPTSFLSSGALVGNFEILTTFYGFPIPIASNQFGKFGDGAEKFIGVKFEIPSTGSTHYGWLRFKDVKQDGSAWTLVDMAYSDEPGKNIFTGQTLGLTDYSTSKFNVFTDSEIIQVNTETSMINSNIEIISLHGQVLYSDVLNSTSKKIPNTFIKGMYIFRITDLKGKAITRKIMF